MTSTDAYEEVLALFSRFDTNNDRVLSYEELRELLLIIDVAPQDIHSVFSDVDRDGSGKVEIDEFVDWVWNERPIFQEKLIGTLATAKRTLLKIDERLRSEGYTREQLFQQAARSRPDKLYRQDVADMMLGWGDAELTQTVIDQAFTLFDWNGDYGVDINEFLSTFDKEVSAARLTEQSTQGHSQGLSETSETVQVTVEVPYSALAGQMLSVPYNGQMYTVAIPSDAIPGGTFEASFDVFGTMNATSTDAPRTLEVIVPAEVYAGQWFSVDHEGVARSFMCPVGCGPGDRVSVEF